MSLQGFPDLSRPLSGAGAGSGNFCLYFPYEGHAGSEYLLAPDELLVASRNDGGPDLQLDCIRKGQTEGYGVLRFRVQPRYSTDEAHQVLRRQDPSATLRPLPFHAGYLRLCSLQEDLPSNISRKIIEAITKPIPVSWNGLSNVVYRIRLSGEAITFVEGMLTGQWLPLSAYAEMEIEGVAPRLNVHVELEPKKLLGGLVARAGTNSGGCLVSRSKVIEVLSNDKEWDFLGIQPKSIKGPEPKVAELAEVLTHWLRIRFGKFVPAENPSDKMETFLELQDPKEDVPDRSLWELECPTLVPMPLVLRFDPLQEAGRLVKDKGLDAICRQIVPELPSGQSRVAISVNLPQVQPKIQGIKVHLYAPPTKYRPSAISKTGELIPPDFTGQAQLQFSPKEDGQYTYRCELIIDNQVLKHPDNPEDHRKETKEDELLITVADLPATFVEVCLEPNLLRIATIHCSCLWKRGGREFRQEKLLSDESRSSGDKAVVFVLPLDAEESTLAVNAESLDKKKTLTYNLNPAQSIRLGQYSFPQFGSRTVTIELKGFQNGEIVKVDLLPEGFEEKNMKELYFPTQETGGEATWTPPSIFQTGYQYRVWRDLNNETSPPPWSTDMLDAEKLTIDLSSGGMG